MSKTIIDISKHNGTVDFEKVKTAGVYGVILRAGYGKLASQKDVKFEVNYKNARKAGLHVGAYWYSYALTVEEAEQEARACLEVLKDKKFDLPVYFDIEEPKQQQNSKTQNTNIVKTFCDIVEYEGYFVGVYSGDCFLTANINFNEIKDRYTIWCARWPATGKDDGKTVVKPKFCTKYDMHQYTAKGKVDGVDGDVDMNIVTRDFVSIIRKNELNGYSNTEWKFNLFLEIPKINSDDLQILRDYVRNMGYKCKVIEKEIS